MFAHFSRTENYLDLLFFPPLTAHKGSASVVQAANAELLTTSPLVLQVKRRLTS